MNIRHLEHLTQVAHTKAFHQTHGIAHVAYFIAVLAEGHGAYALIGGVMVIFSLVNVICCDGVLE